MAKREPDDEHQVRYRKSIERISGSAPWLNVPERKRFRAKIFKSGNSLALRLPAGLGLQPGTEMNLEVQDDIFFSFEPVERPKRKFDIDSIWGIDPGLEPIRPEDRVFEERRFPAVPEPTDPDA